jgi:hypothetical protein
MLRRRFAIHPETLLRGETGKPGATTNERHRSGT